MDEKRITFTVVTLDDGREFVTGEYVDEYSIEDVEEFQRYIEEQQECDEVKVHAAFYEVGTLGESVNATDEEAEYIAEHLDDVLEKSTCLECTTFFIPICD